MSIFSYLNEVLVNKLSVYVFVFLFEDLLKFVREEVMSVRKRIQIQPPKAETPMEPYESYKIDFHLFETMFTAISPLAKYNGADSLAVRLFKVF